MKNYLNTKNVIIFCLLIVLIGGVSFIMRSYTTANPDYICTQTIETTGVCTGGSWSDWSVASKTTDGNIQTTTEKRTYSGVKEVSRKKEYINRRTNCANGFTQELHSDTGGESGLVAGTGKVYTNKTACQLVETKTSVAYLNAPSLTENNNVMCGNGPCVPPSLPQTANTIQETVGDEIVNTEETQDDTTAALAQCTTNKNACGEILTGIFAGGICSVGESMSSISCPIPAFEFRTLDNIYLVDKGKTKTLYWGKVEDATKCVITGNGMNYTITMPGYNGENGSKNNSIPSGTKETPIMNATKEYTMTCKNGEDGPSVSRTLKIFLKPIWNEV